MRTEHHGMLVAVSPPSIAKLRALLDGCDADYFDSYADATEVLGQRRYETVLIGLHFGESRMFDFVREVKARQPATRVLCVQGTAGQLGADMVSLLTPALEALGAEGPVDLSKLTESDCRGIALILHCAHSDFATART